MAAIETTGALCLNWISLPAKTNVKISEIETSMAVNHNYDKRMNFLALKIQNLAQNEANLALLGKNVSKSKNNYKNKRILSFSIKILMDTTLSSRHERATQNSNISRIYFYSVFFSLIQKMFA